MRQGWVAGALLVALAPVWAAAQEEEGSAESGEPSAEAPAPGSLDELSLEELLSLDLKVMSASKREEELTDTSAAIYVVTGEEARRVGAVSIPEALRVVPGMHVGRADAAGWAVATRGFSGRFNTKMLALVDGRSIYTPLFGGVFWEQQDVLLTDLDRIEVIRGPGGTLWGVNAVNGVINVTSKSAADTQGLLATAGTGTEERAFGSVRWGGRVGGVHYRVWGQYLGRDEQVTEDGDPGGDPWSAGRGGFRLDWTGNAGTITVQGDAHAERGENDYATDTTTPPYARFVRSHTDSDGQYLLGRWTRPLGDARGLRVQAYVDRTRLDNVAATEERITADADVQFDTRIGSRNSLVVGAGFRRTSDRYFNRDDYDFLRLDPDEAVDQILNVYAQDELRLFGERVRLVAGSKFEHNSYTGFEIQPTLRTNVRLGADANAWAAVSRAVRTPARLFRDGLFPVGLFPIPESTETIRVYVAGNPDLRSEELWSYEAGWRARVAKALSLDVAAFYNCYRDLIVPNRDDPSDVQVIDEQLAVTVPFENLDDGTVWGGELSLQWNVNERFAVAAAYGHANAELDPLSTNDERSSPRNMANVRLFMNVTDRAEWNVAAYYYDRSGWHDEQRLRGSDLVVPAYVRVDTGLTLRPTRRTELAIWGQNLTRASHVEVKESFVTPATWTERSVYVRLLTRY